MKNAKLTIGIISCVLFIVIAFQSCAAGMSNVLQGSDESSGAAGFAVAILMLTAGIVGIATRTSKGGGIVSAVFYLLAGLIGITSYGSYADLAVWSVLSFIFSAVFFIGSLTMKKI